MSIWEKALIFPAWAYVWTPFLISSLEMGLPLRGVSLLNVQKSLFRSSYLKSVCTNTTSLSSRVDNGLPSLERIGKCWRWTLSFVRPTLNLPVSSHWELWVLRVAFWVDCRSRDESSLECIPLAYNNSNKISDSPSRQSPPFVTSKWLIPVGENHISLRTDIIGAKFSRRTRSKRRTNMQRQCFFQP